MDNAAKVISLLHAGEKRLVFCESRREVEELARSLRERDVTTFVSHSSLSIDERRRAEQAFAEARDCVIVSTSTLELGIDVGDLDRVIQINAPRSVASFLQRLGRTGRRPGSTRNALFLTTTDDGLLQAAGLLLLWSRGLRRAGHRAAVAPPHRRAAAVRALPAGSARRRQRLAANGGAVCRSSTSTPRRSSTGSSSPATSTPTAACSSSDPRPSAGSAAGNFMELVSVFTANPEFTVVQGRQELGKVDPIVLTRKVDGPRIIVLAARSWEVTYIDWKRQRCYVEPADTHAKMRWMGDAAPLSFALARGERDVLLGEDPAVTISKRATGALEEIRADHHSRSRRADSSCSARGPTCGGGPGPVLVRTRP